MLKLKFLISIVIFSSLLVGTSFIKNQTREIEKEILLLNKVIFKQEKDYMESQLDFSYLTSPAIIEKKVKHLDKQKYIPMEFSNIFLSMSDFLDLKSKFVIKNNQNEKENKKK